MLTKIALFNMAAVILDQAAAIIISFILTPMLISILGVSAFGVWQLILRGSTYVSFFDGRSHEMLKWQIARFPTNSDKEKKQLVGASVVVWSSYLSVTIISSLVFVYWIYTLEDTGRITSSQLIIATLLMVFNAILIGLRSFPEAILRGSNKGYKQMGVRMFFLIASGALSIYALKVGYGLIGLATVQVFSTLSLAVVFFFVTKKNIPWLGIGWPTRKTLQNSYRKGFWFFSWSIVNFGFTSIDILLLSFFSTTNEVSLFVVTYYAIKIITTALSTTISAMLPGLGALMGQGDMLRAMDVRKESILYSWWLACSIAITVLLVNQSFVSLWVNKEMFAGFWSNILIVVMALQMVFLRNDSLVINLALEQKQKVKVTFFSLILTVILSAFLIPEYGISGLCISIISGRLILNFQYPKIIRRLFDCSHVGVKSVVAYRGWFISLTLLISASFFSEYIIYSNWQSLVFSAGLTFFCMLGLLFYLGFKYEQRRAFLSRIKMIINK